MSFIGVRDICLSSLSSRAGVGKQRHLTRVLDRGRHVPLVPGAVPGNPPGADLAAVRDVLAEQACVLVVDVGDPLLAEDADLLLRLAYWWLRHHGAPCQSPALAGMVFVLERWLVGVARRVSGPGVGIGAAVTAGATAAGVSPAGIGPAGVCPAGVCPAGVCPAGGGPAGATAALAAAVVPAAGVTAAEAAVPAATALGLSHLGRGVAQRGADVIDLDLEDGALLALLGL